MPISSAQTESKPLDYLHGEIFESRPLYVVYCTNGLNAPKPSRLSIRMTICWSCHANDGTKLPQVATL